MDKEITFPDNVKINGRTLYVSIYKKYADRLDLNVGDEILVTIKKEEVIKKDEQVGR